MTLEFHKVYRASDPEATGEELAEYIWEECKKRILEILKEYEYDTFWNGVEYIKKDKFKQIEKL